MSVQQIKPYTWPSGFFFCIAQLAMEPEELADRYELIFEDHMEDLGPSKIVAIALGDGSQCQLRRLLYDPVPGTNVFVDEDVDLVRACELVLQALGLTPDAYTWVNPHLKPEV